jgi:hypothetical protein
MTATPLPSANQLYDQALLALASKDRDAARQLLASVVVIDPRHAEAWLQLSALMDDVAQSIQCLQHVIAINPAHAKARQWLRLAREAQARAQEAAAPAEPEPEPEPELPMDDPDYAPLEPADQPVPRVGRLLLDYHFVTAEQLTAALKAQAAPAGQPQRLGDILLSQGVLTPVQLQFALREQTRLRAEAARAQPEAALD